MTRHKTLSKKDDSIPKRPVWLIVLVTISVLPVVGWPFLMMEYDFASRDDSTWLLLVMFPVYMIACGYLAYKCYPIRKEITYVLLVIMWLSYGAALLI